MMRKIEPSPYSVNIKNFNSILFSLLVITLFLNGCASSMALKKGMNSIDTSQGSIVLFSLQLANDNSDPQWYPFPKEVWFWSEDYRNERRKGFDISDARCVKGRGNLCIRLISVELKPGYYTLTGIKVLAGSFSGTAEGYVPIYLPIEIRPKEIIYIGSIKAVNRKRLTGEIAAGTKIPLLPQMYSGFASGTFDVQISDKYHVDIRLFKEQFSYLSHYEISKRILPTWQPPIDPRINERWINP